MFHGKIMCNPLSPVNIFPTSTNSLINREQFPSQNPIYFFFTGDSGDSWPPLDAGLGQCFEGS